MKKSEMMKNVPSGSIREGTTNWWAGCQKCDEGIWIRARANLTREQITEEFNKIGWGYYPARCPEHRE
jgi:hypothetical protein